MHRRSGSDCRQSADKAARAEAGGYRPARESHRIMAPVRHDSVPKETEPRLMTSFSSRLARLWPYFAPGRWGFVLALFGALVAAATEPMIPALMHK